MMLISAAIGVVSSVVGAYASYWFDVASGAAIVLAATAIFFVTFIFAPGRGLAWQRAPGRKPRAHERGNLWRPSHAQEKRGRDVQGG
jgi:hypothetical protein